MNRWWNAPEFCLDGLRAEVFRSVCKGVKIVKYLAVCDASLYHERVTSRRERRSERRATERAVRRSSMPLRSNKVARANWLVAIVIAFIGGVALAYSFAHHQARGLIAPSAQRIAEVHAGLTLGQLLEKPAAELANVDIAEANLLCAKGLPGSENLNVRGSLKLIDYWTDQVGLETRRNWHRFKERPDEYENSEIFYRMGMLVTVLQQDLNVHYNAELIDVPNNKVDEKFLADSANMFITGLLGEKRMGTCSSMPVLYAAIGRRLGYPLSLVSAKDHLFLRWQRSGSDEFVNVEATSQGIALHDDNYYKKWRGITDEDIKSGMCLRSLDPVEELAVFVQTRAAVLQHHNRPQEALVAYAEAARLWPANRVLKTFLADLLVRIAPEEFSPISAAPAPIGSQEIIQQENQRMLAREHPEIDWRLVFQKNHTAPKNP